MEFFQREEINEENFAILFLLEVMFAFLILTFRIAARKVAITLEIMGNMSLLYGMVVVVTWMGLLIKGKNVH